MSKIIYSLNSTKVEPIITEGLVATYSVAGQYSYVPTFPGSVSSVFKCWGAAGGGSWNNGNPSGFGGAGASSTSRVAYPGIGSFILTVGEGGFNVSSTNATNLKAPGGGAGTNNGNGGQGNFNQIGSRLGVGGGGQYSSVHYFNGTNYILKTAAGGGGGATNGSGPNSDGQAGISTTGTLNNYANNATSTGVITMNLNGGTGGTVLNSTGTAGGGGGGYGGGAAGTSGSGNSNIGKGGGSLGDTTYAGSSQTPGNSTDTDYISNISTSGKPVLGGKGNSGAILVYGLQNSNITSNINTITKNQTFSKITTSESLTTSGVIANGISAQININTTLSGTGYAIDNYSYIKINNPILTNTTITNAAVFNFPTSSHSAVDSGTTKTTINNVSSWIPLNINGTLHYIPAYTDKTS